MRKNKLIHFNNTIYGLSKDYGFYIDVYRETETTDFKTGKKTTTRFKHKIKKAILLPNALYRDFNYAALFGRDMQYGGILDVTQRVLLINKHYLPKNFKILTTDYVVFNNERYEIQKVDKMELADYYQIIIKQLIGQPVKQVFDLRIKSKLSLTQVINPIHEIMDLNISDDLILLEEIDA